MTLCTGNDLQAQLEMRAAFHMCDGIALTGGWTLASWVESRNLGGRGSPTPSGYKTAAVCPHGHVATDDVELSGGLAGKFCKECGGEILTACPSCKSHIRGHYHVSGVMSLRD